MMDAVTEGDLIARREGAAGIIRLNRPKAINAVTLEMFRDIDKALDDLPVPGESFMFEFAFGCK